LAVQTEIKASLLRRFCTDQIDFIRVAKNHVTVNDFAQLVKNTIGSPESRGKLGGKSSGLFLASRIAWSSPGLIGRLGEIKVPRTWYIASDTFLEFIRYNNLEDVYSRKYMDIGQVRQDYPHTVRVFKNSVFPSEIVARLAEVLDELENRPLIVRSSSLLEDRSGAVFSGKYKSLFLANQGSKRSRLEALQDAVAEVYASIFNPDVIEYRAERGLLDVHEEMAIMIQEVVGTKVGKYFVPAFSGVAFSRNDLRWSPRIQREDGLLRIVPGLGTRAVDRLTDDYPVLIAPGQPSLRANVTPDEVIRYSPKNMDVINIEANAFETVSVRDLLHECGDEYPQIRRIVSVATDDQIRRPGGLGPDFEKDELVVTFEGVISETPFAEQIKALLMLLEESLGKPVDIELASDGTDLYLLQCRPQSYTGEATPAAIPRNLPRDKVLFSANRYISNGRISNVTHIVYVDSDSYNNLDDLSQIKAVGRAVGKLNKLLPKRRFILMGPGRWGSRGDIKLGVSVTYSDINNTALLIEMARRKGNYVPELSFGTHFFQDLVEAQIRYLPLYPDERDTAFNELFFKRSKNLLPDLLPDFADLAETVRVIDVTQQTDGDVCHILMNGELEEAVGIIGTSVEMSKAPSQIPVHDSVPEDHWRWRHQMAERIATELDPDRFRVKALYLFGGVKNATAGPGSDIDLLVHFDGDTRQREELLTWLEGWSLSLSEINYLRTGYRTDGLLDIHIITDQDIARKSSYAVKIDAATDAAKPLPLGGKPEARDQ
jgi:predicted nucleotidyltransferase